MKIFQFTDHINMMGLQHRGNESMNFLTWIVVTKVVETTCQHVVENYKSFIKYIARRRISRKSVILKNNYSLYLFFKLAYTKTLFNRKLWPNMY